MKKKIAVALILMLAAGCSRQDFSRPIGKPMIGGYKPRGANVTKSTSVEERAERLAEVLSQWNKGSTRQPKDYIVGPDDELDIAIYALESPDVTTHLKRTVSKDGFISLPWVGNIQVSDSSVGTLEDLIASAYAERYIKNPQVAVEVTKYESVAVVMTGAVAKPGIYYLNDNKSTVLEMLAMAGGLTEEAADELLVVRADTLPQAEPGAISNITEKAAAKLTKDALLTNPNVLTINLVELIDQGQLDLNVDIMAGAVISVRSMAQQFVYVLGYVQRPGAYSMKGSQQLDALRAVALAGGLSSSARAENTFLVRETDEGQQVLPVDLTKVAHGRMPPVYLESGDTLVVGSSATARMAEFVRPSISAGMSYAPAVP